MGPYLLPPLQLTEDSLEALVHVVKLTSVIEITKREKFINLMIHPSHIDACIHGRGGAGAYLDYLRMKDFVRLDYQQNKIIKKYRLMHHPPFCHSLNILL